MVNPHVYSNKGVIIHNLNVEANNNQISILNILFLLLSINFVWVLAVFSLKSITYDNVYLWVKCGYPDYPVLMEWRGPQSLIKHANLYTY